MRKPWPPPAFSPLRAVWPLHVSAASITRQSLRFSSSHRTIPGPSQREREPSPRLLPNRRACARGPNCPASLALSRSAPSPLPRPMPRRPRSFHKQASPCALSFQRPVGLPDCAQYDPGHSRYDLFPVSSRPKTRGLPSHSSPRAILAFFPSDAAQPEQALRCRRAVRAKGVKVVPSSQLPAACCQRERRRSRGHTSGGGFSSSLLVCLEAENWCRRTVLLLAGGRGRAQLAAFGLKGKRAGMLWRGEHSLPVRGWPASHSFWFYSKQAS